MAWKTFQLTISVVGLVVVASFCAADEESLKLRLRRPAALVLSQDQQHLYVANERSGSISVVNLAGKKVTAEFDVAAKLTSLIAVPHRPWLLGVDASAHQLVLLRRQGPQLEVLERLPVSRYPVEVAATADGRRCFVTSLWSRRVSVVELPPVDKKTNENTGDENTGDENTGNRSMRVARVTDLPFAPRSLLLVRDDSRLIVADSFGGRLGVVDASTGRLLFVREFPGHNIRGLSVSSSGKMLLVSHQMLNELAHTVRNDVHWGLLMSNDLRWLRLDAVLDAKRDLYKESHMHPLGEAGSAASDPAGLAVAENGIVATTLAGVGQLALGREQDFSMRRLKVGRRPTAVVITRDTKHAYVANTFDDSISIVDLSARETVGKIELGPQSKLSLADRGELLFYDGSLSHDGWMSCHSCHTDGHTNSLMNDNFSDASFGAPKRVLSLLGKSQTAPFAWTGDAPTIERQIKKSISVTMQSDRAPKDDQVAALAAFVNALPPPPGLDAARGRADGAAIERGQSLFASMKCVKCHAPPAYTTPQTYDVGVHDKQGNKKFNPPSLIGVGQRGPYFHDNRAETLEEVFTQHGHQMEREFDKNELQSLLAFLRSL